MKEVKPNIAELITADSWRQLFDADRSDLQDLILLAESEESKERARLILAGLKQAESRSWLCMLAMEEERIWLNDLLQSTTFLPEKPELKAAFLVITNQWDRYLNEYGVQGHADLLSSIGQASEISNKILAKIERTSDPSCAKFVLELFFDKASREFSFKTKAGSNSKLETRLQAVLADLKTDDCRTLVCNRWQQTRDLRLAKILKDYDWLPTEPLELRILAGLKQGSLDRNELDQDSVPILIEACRDEDKEIRENAIDVLSTIKDKPAQREILDRLFGKSGDPSQSEYEQSLLDRIISRLEYGPETVEERALFAVLAQDWSTYAKLDPDGSNLQAVFSSGSIELRQRISNCLKESARFDWIVNVCGPQGKLKLSEMNELDWQLLQKSLSASSSWDKLWNLVPVLPASSARKFLQRLAQVGWQPADSADRERFERLLSYSKRLSTEQPGIWSDVCIWKVIDIGGNLFEQLHGGAAMWESRFSFSHDGTEFFMLDRYGDLRTWGLPSCLPGRLHIEGLKPLSAIAASPKQAYIALGEENGSVWICDLEGRKVSHRLRHDGYADLIPSRISYLKFSQNGNFLQAGQRSPGNPSGTINLSWQSSNWQKTPYPFPAYSEVSLDNQWLLYKSDNSVVLEQLDKKRTQSAAVPISFRTGEVQFLPNSRGVLRREGGRLKVLNIPNLMQVDEAVCPNFATMMISDYGNHRLACFGADYSWTFFENPYASNEKAHKPEQDPFFLFNQTLQHSHSNFGVADARSTSLRRHTGDSSRQALIDAGVSVSQVNDLNSVSVGYSVFQGLKDSNSQYFAIVHASGKVSFWVSSLFKYAQKSSALMNEEDFSALGTRLNSSSTSESEKNWIRFMLELAGSYEHCAISISESGNNYVELAQFDIELA